MYVLAKRTKRQNDSGWFGFQDFSGQDGSAVMGRGLYSCMAPVGEGATGTLLPCYHILGHWHPFYCSGICGEQRIIPGLPVCSLALWKWGPEETPWASEQEDALSHCTGATAGARTLLYRGVLKHVPPPRGKDGLVHRLLSTQSPSLEGFPKNRDLPNLFWLTKTGSLILSYYSTMLLMLQSWEKVSEAGAPLSSIML